ncbi:hypothetical protein ASG28_15715 [Frigoribacterium sp. Leaf415]|nr:hypothetical protein ASF07_15065 [Frigoribacterium sp. Leaf254]KQT36920.1 hypothetical protein ASG28_15715 [Frigoribacterium sp. Leaf415]
MLPLASTPTRLTFVPDGMACVAVELIDGAATAAGPKLRPVTIVAAASPIAPVRLRVFFM